MTETTATGWTTESHPEIARLYRLYVATIQTPIFEGANVVADFNAWIDSPGSDDEQAAVAAYLDACQAANVAACKLDHN